MRIKSLLQGIRLLKVIAFLTSQNILHVNRKYTTVKGRLIDETLWKS